MCALKNGKSQNWQMHGNCRVLYNQGKAKANPKLTPEKTRLQTHPRQPDRQSMKPSTRPKPGERKLNSKSHFTLNPPKATQRHFGPARPPTRPKKPTALNNNSELVGASFQPAQNTEDERLLENHRKTIGATQSGDSARADKT